MKLLKKHWRIVVCVSIAIILAISLFKLPFPRFTKYQAPTKTANWGVTFSKKFANSIGLNWQETYLAIINDLQVKKIRLPIYWDNIENQEGTYDYGDYDWMINEGAKKNIEFVLVIGRRLPRWPECHSPEWTKQYPENIIRQKILQQLEQTVKHYQNNNSVITWQVENEPLLDSFGICPAGDYTFLQQEVELIRSLDQRPIMITASGELSDWKREATLGDIFGTTLYRTVWSQFVGYIRYPWPPLLYQAKANNANLKATQRVIAELQAEPWAPNSSLEKLPNREAAKSFTINDFKNNIEYADNVNFNSVYFWGVEWWYLQKVRGNTTFWELAKTIPW